MPEHRLQHSMIFPFPCIHAVSPFGPSMLFLQGLSLKKLPNPPTLAEWDSRTYRERPTYLQRDVAATADGIYSLGAVHACGSHPKGPRQSFLLHVPVYLTSTPTCRYTPKNAYLANSAPAPTQYRNVLRNELCELRGGTGASPGLGVPVRSGCHPSAVTTHANDPRCISNNAAPRNAILLGAARPKEKSGRFPSGPDPSAHNPTLRRAPSATSSLPGPRRGSLRDRPGPRDRRTDGRTDRPPSLPPRRRSCPPWRHARPFDAPRAARRRHVRAAARPPPPAAAGGAGAGAWAGGGGSSSMAGAPQENTLLHLFAGGWVRRRRRAGRGGTAAVEGLPPAGGGPAERDAVVVVVVVVPRRDVPGRCLGWGTGWRLWGGLASPRLPPPPGWRRGKGLRAPSSARLVHRLLTNPACPRWRPGSFLLEVCPQLENTSSASQAGRVRKDYGGGGDLGSTPGRVGGAAVTFSSNYKILRGCGI